MPVRPQDCKGPLEKSGGLLELARGRPGAPRVSGAPPPPGHSPWTHLRLGPEGAPGETARVEGGHGAHGGWTRGPRA